MQHNLNMYMYIIRNNSFVWNRQKSEPLASANKSYLNDNVCILCLYCNVKRSKTTATCTEKSRKHRSHSFPFFSSFWQFLSFIISYTAIFAIACMYFMQ
jgi:hypothetical protein